MSMGKTYLLCAPAGERDAFGRALLCTDIMAKLKTLNPELQLWETFPPGLWWPGKEWAGLEWGVKTTLWLGPPGGETSTKISAIHAGTVPEFTQVGPDGRTIVKGWRQILEKVIKSGACTREALERAFNVTLTYTDDSLLCAACAKKGIRRKHNGGLWQMCKIHEQVVKAAREFLAAKKEGAEAVAAYNESVQRRMQDVNIQVRGESHVGWTPAEK